MPEFTTIANGPRLSLQPQCCSATEKCHLKPHTMASYAGTAKPQLNPPSCASQPLPCPPDCHHFPPAAETRAWFMRGSSWPLQAIFLRLLYVTLQVVHPTSEASFPKLCQLGVRLLKPQEEDLA